MARDQPPARDAVRRSTDWQSFPGTSTCRPILDGAGNTEEIRFTSPAGPA
jgi:hypothetical protein